MASERHRMGDSSQLALRLTRSLVCGLPSYSVVCPRALWFDSRMKRRLTQIGESRIKRHGEQLKP